MVFQIVAPPLPCQMEAINRIYFRHDGQPANTDRQSLQNILEILGDAPTAAELDNYIPDGQLSYEQFEDLLRQQFQNRIPAHVIQTGGDGKMVLSRDLLLHLKDHLHLNYLQAKRYSRWSDSVFRWASHHLGVEWPAMPPTAPTAPRRPTSSNPRFRGLDIRRVSTLRQISINLMSITDIQALQTLVQTRLGVPPGTYNLSYIKDGVRTALRNDTDLLTLKNTIDGVLTAEVNEN